MLKLRGTVVNGDESVASAEHLECALVLRLHFSGQRSPPVTIAHRTCGSLGVVPRGTAKAFRDRSGAAVDPQWLRDDIERAEVRVSITARSPAGDKFAGQIDWTEIPPPRTRTEFLIATRM